MTNAFGLFKHAWEAWDVRVMIILSLFTQIVLFMLGNRRKYVVNFYFKIFLWIAYLGADWLGTAALGKLSSTCYQDSAPNNFLRGLWASSLLLHVGGPDTITAYALEDNQLWKRHLLGLLIQATLAIYVIGLSWIRSWLSLLNFPLFLAGIIKYFERTWSLYRASSKNSREEPPLFDAGFLENISTNNNLSDAETIVMAHQWFALKRPDMKSYLSVNDSLNSLGAKLMPGLNMNMRSLVARTPVGRMVDIVTIELGIMFDMLYTKAIIIYTKLGCILRLISFFCSLFVLVLITGRKKTLEEFQSKPIDIYITESLLVVAVALELYGLFLIVSSDWFILVRYHKKSGLMRVILKTMDWLWSKAQQQRGKKRWSNSMGQFNLLRYCMSFRKRKWMTKILQKIGIDEMLRKHWQTSFLDVPSSFLELQKLVPGRDFFEDYTEYFRYGPENPLFTKGEKALKANDDSESDDLNKDVKDLDESIIIWHMLTDVFYSKEEETGSAANESVMTCKVISDYMMYLVVMKPHMISSDKSMWFDSLGSKLREFLQRHDQGSATASTLYQKFRDKIRENRGPEFWASKTVMNWVYKLESSLEYKSNKWDILRSIWIEIMQYTAINCWHGCHLQELRQGGEFLSFYWLLLNCKYHSMAVTLADSYYNDDRSYDDGSYYDDRSEVTPGLASWLRTIQERLLQEQLREQLRDQWLQEQLRDLPANPGFFPEN